MAHPQRPQSHLQQEQSDSFRTMETSDVLLMVSLRLGHFLFNGDMTFDLPPIQNVLLHQAFLQDSITFGPPSIPESVLMAFKNTHTHTFVRGCVNSQNREVLRSSWTGKLHPGQRAGPRRSTAAGPAAAARPDRLLSAACKNQSQVDPIHTGLERRTGSAHRGQYPCLRLMMVRKRMVTVLMMVKAPAEDTTMYTRRVMCSCCTRTRGRSLAGPGPAGPRINHLSTQTFHRSWDALGAEPHHKTSAAGS